MHTVIATKDAPAAIGPYSQAVRAGGLLFLSGQIPLDPATGELVEGNIQRQTERVLKNLAAVLGAAGATMDHVVRTTIYLVDLRNFADVNAEYAKHFTKTHPARVTVEVSKLPKGAQVEIDAIAALPTAPPR